MFDHLPECWVSIDPGTKIGIAVWNKNRLIETKLVSYKKLERSPWAEHSSLAVVETPQVYQGSPVSPQRMATLAARAGEVARCYTDARIVYIYPKAWKGQLPHSVVIERLSKHYFLDTLSEHEQDAVGIGHHYITGARL